MNGFGFALISNEYGGAYYKGRFKNFTTSAEVKKKLTYTSTPPPIRFMA
jgi:hypothetical protein